VSSAVQVFFNKGFKQYSATDDAGTLAIACSGIVNGVLIFIIQPAFGLSQGMQPIVGYNHGAKRYKRVAKVWRLGILYGTAICLFGTILCMTLAPLLARCFTSDPELVKISAWALRVCCAGFPFIGLGIMSTTYFQSVGRAKVAIFMSLLRQVIVLLPLIWYLPKVYGLNGIWFAGPVSDTFSFLVMLAVALFEFRHLRRLAAAQALEAVA
jgi:Na+-driven multidrug efflux pump